ncbi:MAG: MotA/TolQ/ExbB proton channel family protein [Treponema sp.]|nr:MotA/TolQ/ExbB proton channel family protein [Treponema sp.]
MEFFNFVNLGGPINWCLFVLLCICIFQCVERVIYFAGSSEKKSRGFSRRLKDKCRETEKLPHLQRKKELERECSVINTEMNRGLWFLNFSGAVSPSIGLLGTIVGLISSFKGMSESGGQMNLNDLSGGIWVAMITTEFGMMISIPSLFFSRLFKRIIEKRNLKMSYIIEDELSDIEGETNGE